MRLRRLPLALLGVAAVLLTLPCAVQAQTYPNRPIRLISPFPAGGGNDVLARIIAAKLADRLGGSVVVENRPGAGAVIGIQTLARSKPDGYTLALGSSVLAVAPTLYKKPPFDPNKDFAPVALVAQYPFLLVASASLAAKTLPDLLAMAKKTPGEITYASPGLATSQHLFMEVLEAKTGITLRHIPYNGTAPAVVDIVAGRVSLMFAAAAPSIPFFKNGTLRALAVSSAARLAELPDVPPVADTVPGFDEQNWSIILAPAGTPHDIVDKLHAELTTIMAMPDVAKQLAAIGMMPTVSPPPKDLATFISTAVARWGKIVQQSGMAGTH
jgi:tripartite-type tricarboxylate transporter receptor subunit TctC